VICIVYSLILVVTSTGGLLITGGINYSVDISMVLSQYTCHRTDYRVVDTPVIKSPPVEVTTKIRLYTIHITCIKPIHLS
jgi:hypothetical protein